MRLIHTADIHLDAAFAGSRLPAGFGSRRRQALRDAFEDVLRRAAQWPADAVLIAGDLYDHDRVTRDTVAFLRRCFESLRPVPVFITPGNHDPFRPDSPYATEPWPTNVHIFREPRWQRHDLSQTPLSIHGFGFDGFQISRNPWGELQLPVADGRVHVAVGHGSARSHQPPGKDEHAPFDIADAAPPGLSYLALGHFHALGALEAPSGAEAHYSGAPEGHGFDETGVHYCLEVEIAPRDDGPPRVRVMPAPTSRSVYRNIVLDCGSFGSSQELIDAIRTAAANEDYELFLRVQLTGVCDNSLRAAFTHVQEAASEGLGLLQLVDKTQPAEDYARLAKENTALGHFVKRLNQAISDAPDDATRRRLLRARELGVMAYRGQKPELAAVLREVG